MNAQQMRRPHVYELDPLRTVTAFSVVAVHVLAFTVYLNHTSEAAQIQNALVVALHYTREMFIFVTAFALVYVYYGKPFSLKKFWARRSMGVVFPYCIWSIIYVWVNAPGLSLTAFARTALLDILEGTASYQLYYILLTIQFYILLPLFLIFLKRVAKHPWKVLAVSFILQVVLLYADYHWLQRGTLATSGFWKEVVSYQDRFILIYQFYFLLGGFTALYFEQVRSYLARYGWIVAWALAASIAALWLHFIVQIRIYQEPMEYATSVLQPAMAFYCLPLILFGFWLAGLWVSHKNKAGRPYGYRFWHELSDASFGVYLVHVLFLTALLKWVVPAMPAVWPVALRVFLTWLATVVSATTTSLIFLRVPILSRLVGRAYVARRRSDTPQSTDQGQRPEQKADTIERPETPPQQSIYDATVPFAPDQIGSNALHN